MCWGLNSNLFLDPESIAEAAKSDSSIKACMNMQSIAHQCFHYVDWSAVVLE